MKKKKKKNVEECKEEEGVFSKLPNDITTNILLKLPFKSVGRGRCVCKLWYNILSDTYFLKAQLTQLSKISPDIFLFTRASLVTQQFLYIEVSEEAFKSNPIMPFKVIDYDFISEAFHLLPRILGCCNGFVCISGIKLLQTELPCYPIYVFNPITEEYSDLPQCDDPYLEELECGEERDVCLSGFGFDDSIMEFKLVIVMFVELGSKSGIYENIVQVHTLGSTIWRRMNGVVPDVLRLANETVSVFVHKCLHWVAMDKISGNGVPVIVLFNLAVDEFGSVPTPGSHLFKPAKGCYSLGVLEGNLSVVECTSESNVGIWVMKKYGVKESWVKQFSVEHDSLCRRGFRCENVEIIQLCQSGDLLLLCDAEYLVSYNITNRNCRFLEVEGVQNGNGDYTVACPLVGTLISLKSACGVDCNTRKIISVTEKMYQTFTDNLHLF